MASLEFPPWRRIWDRKAIIKVMVAARRKKAEEEAEAEEITAKTIMILQAPPLILI